MTNLTVINDSDELLTDPLFKENDIVVFRSTDSGKYYKIPQNAQILRMLSADECDIDDVGYMYEIQFEDGTKHHAFEDELQTP